MADTLEISGTNVNGTGVIVNGYERSPKPAGMTWDPAVIPPGRQAHIGDAVWISRCSNPECDAYVLSRGVLPAYAYQTGIGNHEVSAHGAKVPGLNVGLLP